MNHLDEAVEAVARHRFEWGFRNPDGEEWDDLSPSKKEEHCREAVPSVEAAEPFFATYYEDKGKRAVAKDLDKAREECDAAEGRQAEAELRLEELVAPLKDEGRSVDVLSWDELLGVAVRNLNEAMRQADLEAAAEDKGRSEERERLGNDRMVGILGRQFGDVFYFKPEGWQERCREALDALVAALAKEE